VCNSRDDLYERSIVLAMLAAIILAAAAAIVIPVELIRRPFRSTWAWVCKWYRLIRELPRLNQAVENIAWMTARDEADHGISEDEHQQAVQALHDYLTGRSDGTGVRRRPRMFS
jgi:hypothetical protein